jgi:hypothetical protein
MPVVRDLRPSAPKERCVQISQGAATVSQGAATKDPVTGGQRGLAVLLSVNVGMPKDVPWQGKTVYTAAWKEPVAGPRMVRRLNIDGRAAGRRPCMSSART